MTQPLRDYQSSAVSDTLDAWRNHLRVLLVAPTGAGKTRLAERFVELSDGRVLFIVHRRELLKQAAARLRAAFGFYNVGLIAPGECYSPSCRIQVATVQTLLASDRRPPAELLILDEAHHFLATEWGSLAKGYSDCRVLGLTATPERQDGRPLGDIFEHMVVAARYPQLVSLGWLAPCVVYQPPEAMGSKELAQDPVAAYQRFAHGSSAFVFCATVPIAKRMSERFNEAGIPAACITAKTPKRDRDRFLKEFESGQLRVLTNVYTLTEGIDVPRARTCIIARKIGHCGQYLQIVGRVLRPHEDKPHAIVVDLTGATLVHGLPTEDREYSLDGEGIRRVSEAPLRNCPQCGATVLAANRTCPECGFTITVEQQYAVKIFDIELREVYAGEATPVPAKDKEYDRLRAVGREKEWSLFYVQKQYHTLFGERPVIHDATPEEKQDTYTKLVKKQLASGVKKGYVGVMYKSLFGKWPPGSWYAAAVAEIEKREEE